MEARSVIDLQSRLGESKRACWGGVASCSSASEVSAVGGWPPCRWSLFVGGDGRGDVAPAAPVVAGDLDRRRAYAGVGGLDDGAHVARWVRGQGVQPSVGVERGNRFIVAVDNAHHRKPRAGMEPVGDAQPMHNRCMRSGGDRRWADQSRST